MSRFGAATIDLGDADRWGDYHIARLIYPYAALLGDLAKNKESNLTITLYYILYVYGLDQFELNKYTGCPHKNAKN